MLRPVKIMHTPAYPRSEQAGRDSGLLQRLPRRWRRLRISAACAGMLLLLALSGCRDPNGGVTAGVPAPPTSFVDEYGARAMLSSLPSFEDGKTAVESAAALPASFSRSAVVSFIRWFAGNGMG